MRVACLGLGQPVKASLSGKERAASPSNRRYSMLTFVFWNLRGHSLEFHLAELARVHTVDTFLLAEADGISDVRLIAALAASMGGSTFVPLPVLGCRKIRIYSRLPISSWTDVRDTQDMTIRSLRTPTGTEILLAAVHLPSRLRNNSSSNQAALCGDIAAEIRRVELMRKNEDTLLVGDLNLNPFDRGMVEATGLNAVMARRIADQDTRELRGGRKYRMFFNPMWHFFGDARQRPPGTYYYRTNENDCFFWHLFDQVLVRRSLIAPLMDKGKLEILTGYRSASAADVPFVSASGIPLKEHISDHLPLLFGLDLP